MLYVYVCVFEYGKLSFHKHGVVFLQNNFKSTNPTKESGIRLFFGPNGLSYAPFATSGKMKTSENPRISLYLDN